MSTETPMKYSKKILNVAAEFAETAKRVANNLGLEKQGLSGTVINGAILEEYNDRHETLMDQLFQTFGDIGSFVGLWTHEGIKQDYNEIKAMSVEERLALTSSENWPDKIIDKATNPIMFDIGRGNIQSYTAIRLLEEYNQTYQDSDPLSLKHYNSDYAALVSDLQNDLSPTSVKIAGLMIKEAANWAEDHVANWNDLSTTEKEGFSSYYYNVGQDTMNQRYENAVNNPDFDILGQYHVDIANTDIAQEYILNKDAIVAAENTENLFYIGQQKLIADDYFSTFDGHSPGKLTEMGNITEEARFGSGWFGIGGNTNFHSELYGFDIDTNFSFGNQQQETQTFGSNFDNIRNDGLLWSCGNAFVSSLTANSTGFWAEVNAAISDHYQPGRSNLIDTTPSFEIGNIFGSADAQAGQDFVMPEFGSLAYTFDWSLGLAEIDPLVLDLDDDGVELTPFNSQHLFFDIDNDGHQERTGWVAGDDAILVHDLNGDGQINDITETLSEYYAADKGTGAIWSSGFAALQSLDDNRDGVINASDSAFKVLRLWQDKNQNGKTDNGELKTLAEADISELALNDIPDGAFAGGNEVKSNSTYRRNNGITGTLAAVKFIADPNGLTDEIDGIGKKVEVEDGASSYVVGNKSGETVNAGEKQVENIIGGIGNDVLTGDAQNNWLVGSAGEDQLIGGDGDDYLVADAADITDTQDNIQGGNGFDIVQFVGDKGITFNLQQAQVEMAIGTEHADILTSGSSDQSIINGGAGSDILLGGSADDVLNGEEGNDTLYGHLGDDLLRGHRGNDQLVGGDGEDILQGGLGDDVLHGNAGEDLLNGGAGDDYLDGGEGYDVAHYTGSYADYTVTKNDNGSYTLVDRRTDSSDGNDTLVNIEALNFADINEVSLDSDNPLPVKDRIQVSAEADGRTYRIAIADLLANDLDYQGDSLRLHEVFDARGGRVTIDGDEVVFILDKDYTGIPTFSYHITDNKGNRGLAVGVTGTEQTAEISAQVTLVLDHHPNDPQFLDQWYLSEINVLPVWSDYTGQGVSVGIFEPGPWDAENYGQIDYSHPDLLPNIDAESLRTQNPNIEPTQHATLVAGVIGAARNDFGSVGVAYNATLSSEGLRESDLNALLNWQNYDIANNSWGPEDQFDHTVVDEKGHSQTHTLLENAVRFGRQGLGTILVMAGGNKRQDGHDTNSSELTNNRYGITVGAINAEGDLGNLVTAAQPFSNPGASILISAPGSNVTSTSRLIENENGSTFGDEYETTQGTSFAAPIVSGVVALMLEANPTLGWRDVQKILALTAKQIDAPNTTWSENGATNLNGGGMHYSHDYGFGLVDAEAAVRLAESWSIHNTSGNEENLAFQSGDINEAIPDDGIGLQSIITVEQNIQIEHVEVVLNLKHSQLGDVEVVLISPDGTESHLINNPGISPNGNGTSDRGYGDFNRSWTTSSTNHWGENSQGEWKLVIKDNVTGETGELHNWELKFYGEKESANDLYIFTSEFDGTFAGFQGEDSGTDTINSAVLTSDTVINLGVGESTINGYQVSLVTSQAEKSIQIKELKEQIRLATEQMQKSQETLAGSTAQLNSLVSSVKSDITKLNQLQTDIDEQKKSTEELTASVNYWKDSFAKYTVFRPNNYSVVLLDPENSTIVKEYTKSEYQKELEQCNQAFNLYQTAIKKYNNTIKEYNSTYTHFEENKKEITILENKLIELNNIKLLVFDLEKQLSKISSSALNVLIENATTGIGDDHIIGNSQTNTLIGGTGDDKLEGLSGNDTLYGGLGNDIITGGKGNDVLFGGVGNDKFIWFKGDGNDTITSSFGGTSIDLGLDQLVLNDVNSTDIRLVRDKNDIKIQIIPTREEIVLTGHYINTSQYFLKDKIANKPIDSILFADGETWDIADIENNTHTYILGTDGDDKLRGSAGNDIFIGGKGVDIIYGSNGNDKFLWLQGDGNDVIRSRDVFNAMATGEDHLVLLDVLPEQVEVSREDNDIKLKILPSNEVITLSENFINFFHFLTGKILSNKPVDIINFSNGASWGVEELEKRAYIRGTDGDDQLKGSTDDDVFVGGKGDDIIYGSNGNDKFLWARGDGNDTIEAVDGFYVMAMGEDKLVFIDVLSDQIEVSREEYDIKLKILPTNEVITLSKSFINFISNRNEELDNHPVDIICFADGESWNLEDIESRAYIRGTYEKDVLVGTRDDEIIVGNLGNDTLSGGYGDDTYLYTSGDGNDVISDYSTIFWLGGGYDKLVLSNLNSNDIQIVKDGHDAVLTVLSTQQTITLERQFHQVTLRDKGLQENEFTVEEILFSNGEVWNVGDIKARAHIHGTNKDDIISGVYSDDTIIGYKGDDYLAGNNGKDVYIYSSGDGNDTIYDFIDTHQYWPKKVYNNDNDKLIFTDISSNDVFLEKDKLDVKIKILSTGETVTLKNQFKTENVWSDNQNFDQRNIEEIHFSDGEVWNLDSIILNSFIQGTEKSEEILGTDDSNSIEGLKGDDLLLGGKGDDIYYYSSGDGNDTLSDYQSLSDYDDYEWIGGGYDRLVLKDLTASDIKLIKNGEDVRLKVLNTNEIITIKGQYYSVEVWQEGKFIDVESKVIEEIIFSDGEIWSTEKIDTEANLNINYAPDLIWDTGYKTENGQVTISPTELLKNDRDVNGDTLTFISVSNVINGNASIDKDGNIIYSSGLQSNYAITGSFSYTVSDGCGGISTTYVAITIPESSLNNSRAPNIDSGSILLGSSSDETISELLADEDNHIIGAKGNDILDGAEGDDVYYYRSGDGNDLITDDLGSNTLVLEDLNPSDIIVLRANDGNAQILIKSTGETITLEYQLYATDWNWDNAVLNAISFSDGTIWTKQDIADHEGVIGTESNDTLQGTDDNDRLFGRAGDDRLEGGLGDDKYTYRKGDGSDTIRDLSGLNYLEFKDLTSNDITIVRDGDDISININNSNDKITIEDYGNDSTCILVKFSDGTHWTNNDLKDRALTLGTELADKIQGSHHNDKILGKGGNDILDGGEGNDTYLYRKGDGSDTIRDLSGLNYLELMDLTPDDITVIREGSDVSININESSEKITIEGYNDRLTCIFVKFSDGTFWNSSSDLRDNALTLGTKLADKIQGSHHNDKILGKEGNDTLIGDSGNDVLDGGTGDDTLRGSGGEDTFVFKDNFGHDVIRDFDDEDLIEFSGNTFSSYESVLAAMVENGSQTTIVLDDDNSITLSYTSASELQQDDFRFV